MKLLYKGDIIIEEPAMTGDILNLIESMINHYNSFGKEKQWDYGQNTINIGSGLMG